MKQLTRDEIFAAEDLKTEEVEVPEWGEGATVRLRAFSVAVRDAFYAPLTAAVGDDDKARVAAFMKLSHVRLAVFSIVDADGAQMFAEADIVALEKKNPAAVARIAKVAERLNGIGAAALEVAAKNSAASQN